MAVSFMNHFCFVICSLCLCSSFQLTWVDTKPQCSSQIFHIFLFRQKIDDRMCSSRVYFRRVCSLKSEYISGKFNGRKLHAKTNSQKRDIIFPCKPDGRNFPFYSPVSKTSWDNDAINMGKCLMDLIFG